MKALFITCATINSIYCSIWDVAMDWSLLNPYAPNPFLREELGYKRPWVYYCAMVIDPILRFNWIFYAIFESELQHSAILSFLVSLTEVCRRAIWTLFRVENEHCTNVGRFRASRDVPLPYEVPPPEEEVYDEADGERSPPPQHAIHLPQVRPRAASGIDLETATLHSAVPSPHTLRRRTHTSGAPTFDSPLQRGIARVGTYIAAAHAQDFERKKRPSVTGDNGKRKGEHGSAESSDEDELDGEDAADQQDVLDAGNILARHRSATDDG